MEVNKISASIRFSKDIGGSWKSVELAAEARAGGADKAVEPPAASEPTPTQREHWCYPHNLEWKRRTKNGVVWYSHQQGKGWCNQP